MLKRPSNGIFVAFALLVCLLSTPGQAGAGAVRRAAARPPLSGVNLPVVSAGGSLANADREIELAHALHANAVRVEVPWATLEPLAAQRVDQGALAFIDRLVADASADGIRVILLADNTPCWASSAPAALRRKCVPQRPSAANSWPPRDPSAYAAFVATLATRYGTRLAAIEIWNEPDQANEVYFAGPEKPQRYAAILRAAYVAIKQASPRVPVLGGSIVGSNGAFLRALYAAGIKGFYDGLAVHYYRLTLASLRSIHEVQLANGDGKPLWLDEFGWSSCWPQYKIQQEQACVPRPTQAQNLSDIFHALTQSSYVAAAIVYKLESSAREDFGAVSATGEHKPAFATLSKVLASPFGSISPIRLNLRRQGASIVASGSGPVGDFMQLEAFQGQVLRYRALFILDRFNRYSLALPSVLGTHGLRVRVYQYWSGLANAAQANV
jgi:hypothetical protein